MFVSSMQVTSQALDAPTTRKNPSWSGVIVQFPKQFTSLVSLDF